MLVARVSITDSLDITPLSTWLSDHPGITVVYIVVEGPNFYIFYTEAE
jgi:hypothetical protein